VPPTWSAPASAGLVGRPGRAKSLAATVPASWPVAVTARGERALLAGWWRRGAPGSRSVDASRLDSPALRTVGHVGSGSGVRSIWSDPAPVPSASRGAVRSAPSADVRPARSAGSSGGRGGLPAPTPFGPPGRGAVSGAGSGSSAAAGSGVVAAILAASLLLVYFQPLRRLRLMPVMSGPVGFASLQQRPG
jgi:hypothetical protein